MKSFILGQTASKTGKKTPGNSGGGGSGSGGANGGGDGGDATPMQVMAMGTAAFKLLTWAQASMKGKQGKEISWQEFSGQLLESGQVDRILISDKEIARY